MWSAELKTLLIRSTLKTTQEHIFHQFSSTCHTNMIYQNQTQTGIDNRDIPKDAMPKQNMWSSRLSHVCLI